MSDWEVRQGDCLDLLRDVPDASVDAVVTDPPYGLAFMGKDWDHAVPGAAFWSEALRVAKPGAHLLAFGGTRTFHRLTVAIEDAGWEIRDCLSWLYGQGFPKSHNGEWGGTALKPSWEPIIMARKPLCGTVATNWEAFGTGALNIDGCRIGNTKDVLGTANSKGINSGYEGGWGDRKPWMSGFDPNIGRWPANVCLDEDAAAAIDEQSGFLSSGARPALRSGIGYHSGGSGTVGVAQKMDAGGASRFFYVAKPDRAERDMGVTSAAVPCDEWPQSLDGNDRRGASPRRNNHPTVKPVSLMRWLCRLVTPAGGLILDPFTGSGTTGVAAVYEGFRFLGCELDERYCEIARARLFATQPSLFGMAAQ